MAYSYSSPNFFNTELEADWNNTDTSQFLWDSPQPEHQGLPSTGDVAQQSNLSAVDPQNASESTSRDPLGPLREETPSGTDTKSLPHRSAASGTFAVRPSTSETSSQSSSSGSSARRKRKASSTSSPPPPLAGNFIIDEEITSNDFKMDKMFEGSDEGLQFEDNTYPAMGQGMNNLSLNNMGNSSAGPTFDFDSTATSPDPMGAGFFADESRGFPIGDFAGMADTKASNASPQMTVQPSKTFFLGGSGDDSPNSMTMMNSHESSPSAIFSSNSPLPVNNSGLAQTFSNSPLNGVQPFDSSSLNFGAGTTTRATDVSPPGSGVQKPYSTWPCQLEVGPTPEKSRVETQIPINLTLRNAPPGIHRLHLPPHTISKPKFQSKPAFESSDDTLELTAMLVCASAMEKTGIEERAFKRAANDDIYVKSQENQPASSKMHTDDNDPTKPLNGGPVAICSGCIVRERKRAARKKTKKAEEEEEWAKDEAKRVIVFNCPEIRDWCVPGTKETPVKEHDSPLDTIFVHAPMRIACYCRHQSEKNGFQVIFTLRMANGAILAQAISQSIMITDDHKQPSAGQQTGMSYNDSSQTSGPAYFQSGQGVAMQPGSYPQPMPFRNSFSTNDLRSLGNTYAPQRHPPNFSRDNPGLSKMQSTTTSTATSTATTTPRNLSRPASPTNQTGPTKKRRSGGSGHSKVPSGLTMTRMGDMSPASGGGMTSGPTSAGPMTTGFSFSPPVTGGNFGQIDSFQPSGGIQNPFRSGPPTPLHGPGMPNFGSSIENDMYFYSAPTSQHGSRAPSPTPNSRITPTSFPGNGQVPEQASNALARLPPGFNLHRPPIIQRVIPNLGPQQGGDEVTILGTGFFQGLEVMFGDNFAAGTTYWGDTTLVCRSPPGIQPGMVQVMFKHQHQSSDLQQLRGILPTQPVYYEYFDDDRNSMQMLSVEVSSQGQQNDVSQMSQDELSRAFLNTSGGFSNFQGGGMSGGQQQQQQRPGSAHDVAKLSHQDFEQLLLNFLDFMDMSPSPYQARYNKRNPRGGSLLSLAAGLGYRRFCAALLARGADPNPRDRSGYTPLMMATMRNHVGTIQLFSVRGVDPTLRTLAGYTAEDLASSTEAANLLAGLGSISTSMPQHNIRSAPRRPSSTPSLDSLSVLSSSSQPSNLDGSEDGERQVEIRGPGDIMLRNPWSSVAGRQLASHGEAAQAYSKAFAALVTWREQMLSQLHQFQQTIWTLPPLQLPGLPPMPSLPSLPHKINRLDYQQYYDQYPMVRRISDFLSPVPASPESFVGSIRPPAYEDIFPKPPEWTDEAEKGASGSALQATVDAAADQRCAELFDGPIHEKDIHGRSEVIAKKEVTSTAAAVYESVDTYSIESFDASSVFPWVLLLVALLLGVWNYTAPESCSRSAPLARLRGFLPQAGVAGPS